MTVEKVTGSGELTRLIKRYTRNMKISVPNTLHAKKEMYSPGELNSHHASQYFLKNLISVTKIRLSEQKTKQSLENRS